jgi:hypothetical protein
MPWDPRSARAWSLSCFHVVHQIPRVQRERCGIGFGLACVRQEVVVERVERVVFHPEAFGVAPHALTPRLAIQPRRLQRHDATVVPTEPRAPSPERPAAASEQRAAWPEARSASDERPASPGCTRAPGSAGAAATAPAAASAQRAERQARPDEPAPAASPGCTRAPGSAGAAATAPAEQPRAAARSHRVAAPPSALLPEAAQAPRSPAEPLRAAEAAP